MGRANRVSPIAPQSLAWGLAAVAQTRTRLIALALLGAAVAAMPAAAHHSFAMFDQKKVMTLVGTVHEFQWTNPHAFLEIDVPEGGKVTRWSLELNSPNNLKRQGWSRSAVKMGDKVSVRMNPLRDGQHGGLFLDLKFASGKVLDSGLPKDGTPVNVPRV